MQVGEAWRVDRGASAMDIEDASAGAGHSPEQASHLIVGWEEGYSDNADAAWNLKIQHSTIAARDELDRSA
jgi:hypothetical protein